MSTDAPLYYLKRDSEYLNWSGHLFTDDENCAWLGTAAHVVAFRAHHPLARADRVKIISAVDVSAAHKNSEVQ